MMTSHREHYEIRKRIAELEKAESLWEDFLSDQDTIEQAGWQDNYTDAARARARQVATVKSARDLIAEKRRREAT